MQSAILPILNFFKTLHQWMKDLFSVVKSINVKDTPGKRKKLRDKCIQEMKYNGKDNDFIGYMEITGKKYFY